VANFSKIEINLALHVAAVDLCRDIEEISAIVVVESKENEVLIGPRHTCTWNMCKCLLWPQHTGVKRNENFGEVANEGCSRGATREAGTLASRAGMQAGAHRTIAM
jgi:hypothetical protein